VKERQIGVEVGVSYLDVNLLANECETLAEFKQELLDLVDQSAFEVTLATDVRVADEIEDVGVAGRLLRQIGVGRRDGSGEVRDCSTGALVDPPFDVVDKNVAAPPLVDGGLGIPKAAGLRCPVCLEAPCVDAKAIVQRCAAQLRCRATPRRTPACT
jgi:hypothetical protein